MPSLDSKVTCNLFYYQEAAYLPEKVFLGYLKASVLSITETGFGKKPKAHAYFPLFFVPFMVKGNEYIYADHLAFQATDVSDEDHDVLTKQWAFSYLNPPTRERERLQIIHHKLSENLETFVRKSNTLRGKKTARRNRFLGQFPRELREGIDEKVMYGTLDKQELAISIYESDFGMSKDKHYIPRGNLSRERLSHRVLRSLN